MKVWKTEGSWTRAGRFAAAVSFGLLAAACGGSAGGVATPAQTSGGNTAAPTAPGSPSTPASPATPPTSGSGTSFSWTKPAGWDAALQAAISSQPSFMGGYGGQIDNPFPQLGDTALFPGMQITRPDAIQLGEYFGRWAFRFYVDANSRHSNGLRAEFTGIGDYQYGEGDTVRCEWSTYFDEGYANSSWTDWNMFAQFHSLDFPAWGLHTAGGYLHMGPPGAAENQFRVQMPSRNTWHSFVWTIHWSSGSSGSATLEMDGSKLFDYSGPTIHAGETTYYPKFGSYLANNPYTQVTFSTPWKITKL